jgi:hypothetical protein
VRTNARLRGELKKHSGLQFQSLVRDVLTDVLDEVGQSSHLGEFDSQGIDCFVISDDERNVKLIIQCKGFEVLNYEKNQHSQCRREIAKYRAKGPPAEDYWLVLNRPIKSRKYRAELDTDLKGLVQSGKVKNAIFLDLLGLADRLSEFFLAKLLRWSEQKRNELVDYYAKRMSFVRYIEDVPFTPGNRINPVKYLIELFNEHLSRLHKDQTGRYRNAPRVLLTSEFGFGKTSTLHSVSERWVQEGRHLIYAPAHCSKTQHLGTPQNWPNLSSVFSCRRTVRSRYLELN